MSTTLAGAPPSVAAALERLKSELAQAAGGNLAGLVLYGGLARGRYRPGKSDVNVVVLLRDMSAAQLAAIGPALRRARRAIGVAPLLVRPTEVTALAAAFPTKFLDIHRHNLTLAGENPFTGLSAPADAIRRRVAQHMRNLTLRLRRTLVALYDDEEMLKKALASAARPLALELAALLPVTGQPPLADDHTATIFAAAAAAFQLDAAALASLVALRHEGDHQEDPRRLFDRVLGIVQRIAEAAEGGVEGGR